MQKSSKFINLTTNFNHGPSIISHKAIMLLQTCLELIDFRGVVCQISLLLQNREKLARLGRHLFMFLNKFLYFLFDNLEHLESLLGKVLWWCLVFRNRLQVLNGVFCILLLIVDDILKRIKLSIDLFDDLQLKRLLIN